MSKTNKKPAARSAEPKTKSQKTMRETVIGPDWVNETPDATDYSLMMNTRGDCEQDIPMTREEFIRLKRCLAALRGLPLGAPREHWDYHHTSLRERSPEELMELALEITQEEIQIALDLHQACSVLVMNFRRRLKIGAQVEAGKWEFHDEGEATAEDTADCSVDGGYISGLDIHSAKTAAA